MMWSHTDLGSRQRGAKSKRENEIRVRRSELQGNGRSNRETKDVYSSKLNRFLRDPELTCALAPDDDGDEALKILTTNR